MAGLSLHGLITIRCIQGMVSHFSPVLALYLGLSSSKGNRSRLVHKPFAEMKETLTRKKIEYSPLPLKEEISRSLNISQQSALSSWDNPNLWEWRLYRGIFRTPMKNCCFKNHFHLQMNVFTCVLFWNTVGTWWNFRSRELHCIIWQHGNDDDDDDDDNNDDEGKYGGVCV